MTSFDDDEVDSTMAAAHWCMRLAEGHLSAEEQYAFETWLDADPAHVLILEKYASIWGGVADVASFPEMLLLRTEALEKLNEGSNAYSPKRSPRQRSALLVAIASLLIFLGMAIYAGSDRPEVYQTGIGERRVVKLEDGSTITMDAATRVEVDYGDGGRRLQLSMGRATFEVAKDSQRVFTVAVGNKIVVATGTEFSVEKINKEMRVVLYEGRVDVLDKAAKPEKLVSGEFRQDQASGHSLEPGTTLIAALDGSQTRIEETDLHGSLAWESGQLTFNDEPLAIAAERVNRYSSKRIVVEEAIGGLLVSGAFNSGDAESFVDGVSLLYELGVSREGDLIRLRKGARENSK